MIRIGREKLMDTRITWAPFGEHVERDAKEIQEALISLTKSGAR